MALKDLAVTTVAINCVMLSVSTILVVIRCIIRQHRNAFGLDDWLLVLAQTMFVVNIAICNHAAFNGVGEHHLDWTSADMEEGVKYFTLFQLFLLTGTVPIKASICVSLLRITPKITYKRIIYVVIGLSVVTSVVADFTIFLTCRPFAYTWDKTLPDGKCYGLRAVMALSYAFSWANLITDFSCTILPAFILWHVQMSRKVKLSVLAILGMGILASVATVFRLGYFVEYTRTVDYLYGISNIIIWSSIESGLGLIAAALSALKPVLVFIWRASTSQSSSRSQNRGPYLQPVDHLHLRDLALGQTNATVSGRPTQSDDSIPSVEQTSEKRVASSHARRASVPFGMDRGIVVTQSFLVEGSDCPSPSGCRMDPHKIEEMV